MARPPACSEGLAFSLPARTAEGIWSQAVAAVDPARLVAAAVTRQGDRLHVAGSTVTLSGLRRIGVLAVGKAAVGMVRGLLPLLPAGTDGLIVVPHGQAVAGLPFPCLEAAHPVPDADSLGAALTVERWAQRAGVDDLVIVLLSGGASALLADPAPGLSFDDLRLTTEALLASGLPIDGVNVVRKHLSRLKGGGLARLLAPARVVTLVISDVPGNRLDVIGSGPTVPDASTFAEAVALVSIAAQHHAVPETVREHLAAGAAGRIPETAKGDEPFWRRQAVHIIGDHRSLLQAAVAAAHDRGLGVTAAASLLAGEAADVGRSLARTLLAGPAPQPHCWLWAGETTVTLPPAHGRGGRNQELALAAAVEFAGIPGVGLLAAGSDGIDGPTDAAGAWVDGHTVGHDTWANAAAMALAHHDAYPFLAARRGLWRPGLTGTNVGDLVIGLRWPVEDDSP